MTFRCTLVGVSVLLVGMSPRESFHVADCELYRRIAIIYKVSWLVDPLRRCVAKQTPAAPEV